MSKEHDINHVPDTSIDQSLNPVATEKPERILTPFTRLQVIGVFVLGSAAMIGYEPISTIERFGVTTAVAVAGIGAAEIMERGLQRQRKRNNNQ